MVQQRRAAEDFNDGAQGRAFVLTNNASEGVRGRWFAQRPLLFYQTVLRVAPSFWTSCHRRVPPTVRPMRVTVSPASLKVIVLLPV